MINNRAVYVMSGKEFEERFNNVFGELFWLMTRDEFLEKNFLGFGEKHKKIEEFIGNYIALSTGGSIIRLETFLVEGKPVKKSTHCGLSKEEMEVPLLVCTVFPEVDLTGLPLSLV